MMPENVEGKKSFESYDRIIRRERAARKKAEELLEDKAYLLFEANKDLRESIAKLEAGQEQLILSEKMAALGKLTATIAHEINNPLAYLYSNLQYLQDCVEDLAAYQKKITKFFENSNEVICRLEGYESLIGEKKLMQPASILSDFSEIVEEAIEGASRINSIVKEISDYSHSKYEFSAQNIRLIIESAILTVSETVVGDVNYISNIPLDHPIVNCDSEKMLRVFRNLLINAAQAMPNGGDVEIAGQDLGRSISIEISDNGPGVLPEDLEKIFEPFYTTKKMGQGVGLGLYISKKIVEDHKGSIAMKNRKLGGVTFSINLPKMPNF